ncbi:isochorismate synthase [uncultured Bacteroides sp.]|uniref:isochorismate synthase n=1 Tax=uncultured Bacteroides sp. TaxID=162156 RepID=UPI00267448AE|nr:isochorismate synthase [uncultured Bacteroides sp.]
MTDEEISNLIAIDTLIRRKQPFAVYRIPGETVLRLVTQAEGTVRLIADLQELNGQRGFVIAPFKISGECPAVLVRADGEERLLPFSAELREEGKNKRPVQDKETLQTVCSEKYASRFRIFIQALRDKTFDKLVLSRSVTVGRTFPFSPSSAFQAACKRYIHSYVYLCYTPQTGMWLGSTPEVILSGGKDGWHTVALAGTQPLQAGRLPQVWDNKNRKEQEYVTSYIRRQLLSLGIRSTENGPYPAYAGALSHLKTDFSFSLKNNKELGNLLKVLHPTPAVCGLPKETAYRFILENEGYERRYYSGFIGWLEPDGKTDLYVNLRCMHIEETQLTLYAGGGLLASSELDDEWLETEKKLQTMKRIIISAPRPDLSVPCILQSVTRNL